MAFSKMSYRYTCQACILYDTDAAAEDKNEHVNRAKRHTVYFCPACRKTSCTPETLSAHFDDGDSPKACQRFQLHDATTIKASYEMQMLRASNAPAPEMQLHRESVTAAQYLVKKRDDLLLLNPSLKLVLPLSGEQ